MTDERAKRIAEAVIEAAAQICDGVNNHDNPMTASDCADAIRALDLDAIIASMPGPETVAYAVISELGGIHKLAIQRDSAERKAEKWKQEWPNNKCEIKALCFAQPPKESHE